MKFLQFDQIEHINNQLSSLDQGETRTFARMECYSCKHTKDDFKLKHHIESIYDSREENLIAVYLSPKSPFGPLSQNASTKTFLYLLATLNAVYPDYDFSDVKPDFFHKVPSLSLVRNNINNTLLAHFGGDSKGVVESVIWDSIDEVITVKNCDLYSFNPTRELEPDSEEGNIWSFFYFFYNKPEKRILFFTSRAISLLAPEPDDEGFEFDSGQQSSEQFMMDD